jgi:hypothetical protein
MARGQNWIADWNPRQLAKPPEWFLEDLWRFDDQLVIMPTRDKTPIYRLTRRTTRTAGFKFIATLLKGMPNATLSPDTKMMALHRVVPVATLTADTQWTPRIFAELAARDTWRVGGGDKAADILDAQDAAKEKAVDDRMVGELHERVNRSFEHYKARTGQRLSMMTPSAQVRMSPPEKSALAVVS